MQEAKKAEGSDTSSEDGALQGGALKRLGVRNRSDVPLFDAFDAASFSCVSLRFLYAYSSKMYDAQKL